MGGGILDIPDIPLIAYQIYTTDGMRYATDTCQIYD